MDFSKRSQTEFFFSSIIDDLRKNKIVAVFSLSPMSWNHYRRYRTYSTDTEIFILLENDYCLVIDYRFIDSLDIQYRKMTGEEKNEYSNVKVIDFFNTINDIHDSRLNRIYQTQTCNLEYGTIEEIALRAVTKEYSKWIDDEIEFVKPTKETFDEIRFTMSNGKSLVICADVAEVDGYTLFWSEDTVETITDR